MSFSEDLNEGLSLVSCLEDLNMPSISSRYSVYTLGSGSIFCPYYLGKGSVLPYSFGFVTTTYINIVLHS